MRPGLLCLIPIFLLFGSMSAQSGERTPDHHDSGGETVGRDQPPITVTINPEARVSVAWLGNVLPPVPCGTAATLRVKILNRGFITSRLEVEPVGEVRNNVNLDFEPSSLKGVPEEIRNLRITLKKPDPTDVTLAFKLVNETPDLGGRDRIHFLMHCLETRRGEKR
jgi:hypothetical protein